MKALSVKQPWAWLICAGYKDIENRNWKIGQQSSMAMRAFPAGFYDSFPQRIYIHAGKKGDFGDDTLDFLAKMPDSQALIDFVCLSIPDSTFGAIIGEVDITACVDKSDSSWFVGKYGFVLANPKLYDTPIPYRGQLGFFEVNLESVKKLERK